MATASRRDIEALETTEKVIAALRGSEERDGALQGLVRQIENDRARIPASTTSGCGLTRRATFWPDCPI